MNNDQWDFSAYDRLYDKIVKAAEPKKSDVIDVPEEFALSTNAAEEAPNSEPTEESALSRPTVKAPKRIGFLVQDEQQGSVRTWESVRQPDGSETPRPPKERRPIGKEEIVRIAESMAAMAEITSDAARQLTEIIDNVQKRKPKGLRISRRRLDECSDTFLATKTIMAVIAETERQEVFATLEQSKLNTLASPAEQNLKDMKKDIEAHLQEIQTAADTDGSDASTVARELKQQVISLHNEARQLAGNLCETTFAFPSRYGQLDLFRTIAQQGYADDMARIDRTMRRTGEVVISVSDAQTMINAIEHQDQRTADAIAHRMIDAAMETSIS